MCVYTYIIYEHVNYMYRGLSKDIPELTSIKRAHFFVGPKCLIYISTTHETRKSHGKFNLS